MVWLPFPNGSWPGRASRLGTENLQVTGINEEHDGKSWEHHGKITDILLMFFFLDHHYLVFSHIYHLKLVGGWEHFLLFPSYWECRHPNWRSHIFQRCRYTTNQIIINHTLTTSEGLKPPTSKGITLRKWCARLSKNAVSPGDDSARWWAQKRCRGPRTLRKLGFMVSIL